MPKVMIGVIAMRRPDGSFLPAQPIYRRMTVAAAQMAKENMLRRATEMAFKELYGRSMLLESRAGSEDEREE